MTSVAIFAEAIFGYMLLGEEARRRIQLRVVVCATGHESSRLGRRFRD